MSLYEMLKQIVDRNNPWGPDGACLYCRVAYSQEHWEDCTWRQAQEYIEMQEEVR